MTHATSQPHAPAWKGNPYGLVSLWEIMEQFSGSNYWKASATLMSMVQDAASRSPKMVVSDDWKKPVLALLNGPALDVCATLSLTESLRAVCSLMDFINTATYTPSVREIGGRLAFLRELIESESEDQLFLVIPKAEGGHYGKKKPLGDDVYEAYFQYR
jgi:hypothetical protein